MYHAEDIIDGVLCWKGLPDEPWKPYTAAELTQKLTAALSIIRTLHAAQEEASLDAWGDNFDRGL